MPIHRTQFNGYSVAFSPFLPNRIAVATSQNFGIIGNGRQYVLDFAPGGGPMREVRTFDTADGLYDCCWCEDNENVLVSASGDGSVKVWDLSAPPQANPLRSLEEHRHEVYSVAWNVVRRDCFLSASWDDTVKLWNLVAPHSVRTFAEHGYCVYAASWNPAAADVFATASGDCTVKLWDVRAPYSSCTLPAHGYEVLAVDWCKYNDAVLATGSVDKTIRLWDVRAPSMPLATLGGHGYAVRRVKWSPWSGRTLFSCSYDMTVAAWDCGAALGGAALAQPLPPGLAPPGGMPGGLGVDGAAAMLRRWDHHTEFAVGLDASPLVDGLLASCGWDETAAVWHCGGDPRQPTGGM